MNIIEVVSLTELANMESSGKVSETENEQITDLEYFINEPTDAECTVCLSKENPNTLLLTFIGSNSKDDWLADIDFFPIPLYVDESKTQDCLKNHVHDKFKVHRGIHTQFIALWEILEKKIQIFFEEKQVKDFQKASIVISGHSLGGGLAIIAAIYVHRLIKQNNFRQCHIKVVTIGAPRVVNDALAMWYNSHLAKNTFRIVNHYDTIPNLPFDGPLFKYCHVDSTLIYFKNKELLSKEPYRTIFDRMIALKGGFKNHGIKKYIELLNSFDILKKVFV